MIIEIKGVQFVNKGAELMLHAILDQVSKRAPETKFVLRYNKNSPYIKRAQAGCYLKLERKRLGLFAHFLSDEGRANLMEKWGACAERDIDVVLDASGFAYGDQWGSNKLKKLSTEIENCAARGGKYIFMPQAFGPFSKSEDLAVLAKALPKASLVCAREEDSHTSLNSIRNINLKQYPDFTNLLSGQCPEYFSNGAKTILIIPNANMISKRNAGSPWNDAYIPMLKNAVKAACKLGYTPVLLNHEGPQDHDICEEIANSTAEKLQIINEDNPVFVKGIIGSSAAVICSRFHGCVSAFSQSVPCIGTSWSHKYERLFAEYGQTNRLLNASISEAELEQVILSSLKMSTEEKEGYLARANVQKQNAQAMWEDIFSLLKM